MKKSILILLLICVIACKKEDTKSNTTNTAPDPEQTTPSDVDFAIEDEATFITKYDFSPFFKPQYNGVFGEKRSSIKIYFSNVYRTKDNPAQYNVKGYSVHKEEKVPFEGTITLDKVFKINNNQLNVMLNYTFKEASGEHGAGVFIGNGIAVKNQQGLFTGNNFIGEYQFPDGNSVMCNFK